MVPPITITKSTIVSLIALITNQNPNVVANSLSEDQAQTFALNIGKILTPDQIFPFADMAAFEATDPISQGEALVYAATKTPLQVFTGAPGLAKLAAWATGAGYTHP